MNYSVVYINEYEAWLQYDNYNIIFASMYDARVHLVIVNLNLGTGLESSTSHPTEKKKGQ
jgi:hypothetical protein